MLLYFYGHGVLRGLTEDGVLATSDGELYDEGVAMDEVIELANKAAAAEVVLVFDCCHAGAAVPATDASVPRDLRPDKGRVLIAACAEHEQGWEIKGEDRRKLGALSTCILEGLSGAAVNSQGEVTAAKLGQYVVDKFSHWNQHPIWTVGGVGDRLCKLTWRFEEAGQPEPTFTSSLEAPNWKKADIELVKIPSGEFLCGEDKKLVSLDEFWIGRTPVTNRQYQVFADSKGYDPPEHWEGKRVHPTRMNHPVVAVSWYDAQAFCEWAGVFLPTEQQWEKAARGIDGRDFPWGNQNPSPKLCNFDRNVGQTSPVGRYSPHGDSPYGIIDMAGNVWEWCEDLVEGNYRALRGGSFYLNDYFVRCAYQYGDRPHLSGSNFVGFRVMSPTPIEIPEP